MKESLVQVLVLSIANKNQEKYNSHNSDRIIPIYISHYRDLKKKRQLIKERIKELNKKEKI